MTISVQTAVFERPAVLVPIALVLLAAAGGLMWTNLHHRTAGPAVPLLTEHHVVPVLIASRDIVRGQLLSSQEFSVRNEEGATTPFAALHQSSDAQSHIALTNIKAGAPIFTGQVSKAALPGIAAHIPEGFRAYSLPVSEAEIAGGFLQVGDHVDLYVNLPGALFSQHSTADKPADKSKSILLLQSIAVLAVGNKLESDGSANTTVRTVTLAINAADLAKLALANRLGIVTFAIRNPIDDASLAPSVAALETLAGQTDLKPAITNPHQNRLARGIPILSGRKRATIARP